MTYAHTYSGTRTREPSPRELEHGRLARRAAAGGIVLLKNTGTLPLDLSAPVALFGSGASRTVKGGIGSGDVNNRANVSICQGLKDAGLRLTSENWLEDYEARYHAARAAWKQKVLEAARWVENPFDAYAANPFVLPQGRPIVPQDVQGAAAAIYVLSRIAGEGKDRRLEKGDYYLSDGEWNDLRTLDRLGLPIVLLINAGGPVELTDLLDGAVHIEAVLQLSQLGQEGGHAVADVLLGKTTPEGKLTATWARRYTDYPCAESFSYLDGDLEKAVYREGIYVGYRYFDSFGVQPLFPFGYGLSYTDFSLRFAGLRVGADAIEVDVEVENAGICFSGREVAQVYISCPQNGGAKELRRLAGFAKTRLLAPEQRQTLTICIPQKQLATFAAQKQGWVVEQGLYGVWVGNSSAAVTLCAQIRVDADTVIEQTHPICPLHQPLDELGAADAAQKEAAHPAGLPVYGFCPRPEPRPECPPAPLAEGPVEELIPLLYGNITKGTSTLGSAGVRVPGSAGESTEELEASRGVPSLIMADGPAGLRLRQSYQVDRASGRVYGVGVLGSLENGYLETPPQHDNADTYYQFCTAFPVGTALAQTWDTALMEEFGRAVAREMEEFGVDLWLAPGMNIQRNPLCGRNFEYYAEDPLLSGVLAAAVTRGVQHSGRCGVTVKHFACNNQEDNRMGVDVRISQRALREIYLRGFEIAVKTAAPAAIMSSYNRINGVYASNSRDLCTVLAREEWGFDGVIMSDWNTTVPADGSIPWQCAAAGNDIIMPGNPDDDASIRSAYAAGRLTEQDIRACAGRVIALAARLRGQEKPGQ